MGPLPQEGEREGTWRVEVFRPDGRAEFAEPAPEMRFFLNVVASGGALLRRKADRITYYTGDRYNPRVQLQYAKGGLPSNARIQVTVSGPDASLGTILSRAKLSSPASIGGDVIPARQATLAVLEAAEGKNLIGVRQQSFELDDSPANNDGAFESAGNFGLVLQNLLTVDGDYTFRAHATYGSHCIATRERIWAVHVEVGIDPNATITTTTITGGDPSGHRLGTVTIIPRDKYGNYLGPGRTDGFTVVGVPGVAMVGPVHDNGDGSYSIPVSLDPGTSGGVAIVQPGRAPVIIEPRPSPTPPAHERAEAFTGKVVGIVYDRFGDFEGFLLLTEDGRERHFRSREHEIEELVCRAWIERVVISVIVDRGDPLCPVSIILRRAPEPFQE